jgi:hypothetical protein
MLVVGVQLDIPGAASSSGILVALNSLVDIAAQTGAIIHGAFHLWL